jgi:rhodanese-related sulfurtransferase
MVRAIGEMIILGCLAIVISLVYNGVSSNGIPLFGNWDPSAGSLHAGGPCKPKSSEAGEDMISAMYLDPMVFFIDARSADDYAAGHIPRAVSYPVNEFDGQMAEFFSQYPPDTRLVVYCTGLDCHDSHTLAQKLKDAGYTQVMVYSRGFTGWKESNRPVKEGSEP